MQPQHEHVKIKERDLICLSKNTWNTLYFATCIRLHFRHETRLLVTQQKVEAEIHNTLLKHDGLVESAATNQGAWLTESAGALSDLHAAVLRSLGEFSMRRSSSPPSRNGVMFGQAAGEAESAPGEVAVPARAESSYGGNGVSTREGDTTTSIDRYQPIYRQEGDENARAEGHGVSLAGGDGVAYLDAATCTADGKRNAANSQDSTATKATASATDRSRSHFDEQRDQRRARLQHLGLLLARKRQFAASRQVSACWRHLAKNTPPLHGCG